jgi:glucose-6-phosphate 1-dehydrogenase
MTDTVFSTTLLPAGDACRFDPPRDPCLIVILGASGDLTSRKIIPSLYSLFQRNALPGSFAVLGCSRTQFDSPGFRSRLQQALEQAGADMSRWGEFADRLYYQQLLYDERPSFDALAAAIGRISGTHQTGANCLYYLALPPFLFETAITLLGEAGLAAEPGGAWRRIVVEKPFGSDLQSAMRLDAILGTYFQEHQIFRIDHYLAKETVQNILAFRFANAILRPLWSRKYIEYIDICALETLGIEHRAGYYEKAGVLRDMFQNHMLQLLSLVAMEQPAQFLSEQVRTKKAAVFKALRPFDLDTVSDHIVLGQYTEGAMDGQLVPGYRQEQGVDPQSLTPTFASMKVFIDNRRWKGVPFYLTSGKRMREKETRITVQFRDVIKSLFRNSLMPSAGPNRLTFTIQPQEKITLSFRAKNPGPVMCFRPIDLAFSYDGNQLEGFEAYAKVLVDCLNGDQMLSLRQDSEELCWAFLTPLIEDCELCVRTEQILHYYPAGSSGPAEAEKIRRNR